MKRFIDRHARTLTLCVGAVVAIEVLMLALAASVPTSTLSKLLGLS